MHTRPRLCLGLALFGLGLFAIRPELAAQVSIISTGAVWRYLDTDTNPGDSWSTNTYQPFGWKSGPAPLGYPGGALDARFNLELIGNLPLTPPEVRITAPTPGSILNPGAVQFHVQTHDFDGSISSVRYYVNGFQVDENFSEPFNVLWPNPPVGRYRLVAEAVDNSGRRRESAPVYFQVGTVTGTRLTRGPYLQSCTTTSIVVCWRTDWPSGSTVYYGPGLGDLDFTASGAAGVDHAVRLTGLEPETTYVYALGDESGIVQDDSEWDFRFTTAPARTKPVRIWAIGDSGTTNAAARAVRNAYLDWVGTGHTDVWLMLGDNAYEEGKDDQYQHAVFEQYPMLLRNTVLWPTLGNHDAAVPGATEAFPYLEIFALPRQGEAGGLASGTELYYSFDYANIHFICLDSHSSDRRPGSPMLTWLENDLAATSKDWIIAYWHHPPYTWGTHNSDGEIELIEMRQYALPVLEHYGVDLVLSGHSHVYERSFFLNGHYGFSWSLAPSMMLNGYSGHPDEGAYRKPSGGLGANQGTAYAVCGCSGEGGPSPFRRHPAMFSNLAGHGSMVIDVNNLRMDVQFLTDQGIIADWFTIDKSAPEPIVRPTLAIRPTPDTNSGTAAVELSWPTSRRGFQLETRSNPGSGDPWQPIAGNPELHGRTYRLTQPAPETNRIYRLRSVR